MMQNPGGAEGGNAAGQRRGRGRARWQRETIRQRGTNLVCVRGHWRAEEKVTIEVRRLIDRQVPSP